MERGMKINKFWDVKSVTMKLSASTIA